MIKSYILCGRVMGGMGWSLSSLAFVTAAILLEGVALAGSSGVGHFPARRFGRGMLDERMVDGVKPRFDIPSGSQILLESRTRCKDPVHPSLFPKRALLCNWMANITACMGVGPRDALFVGSGCVGEYCTLDLIPGPTECVLESYGIAVDTADEGLKETCGLSKEDHDWVMSGEHPVWEIEGCELSLPSGTSSHIVTTCSDGNLGFHFGLNFTNSDLQMPKEAPYTCKSSPSCGGKRGPSLVCHSEEKIVTNDATNDGAPGAAVMSLSWGLALLVANCVLFGLLF
ncbi:hypothetical protein BSKO_13065 [Bryopsis sp. KO-2023]|nr:hypothetical protein BSKO_13065 [Bryopsis sp. KO-2023]